MKQVKYLIPAAFFILTFSLETVGQQFIYRPVNPAFGGNQLNYQWLLGSAQVQSDFKEESPSRDLYQRDPLDDFETNLSRLLLNQLSRQIMVEQFGEGHLQEGNYALGNYEIEVSSRIEGLVIYIFNSSTGGETTITIPHY
jgi:curli production assembly/transport component CsgF